MERIKVIKCLISVMLLLSLSSCSAFSDEIISLTYLDTSRQTSNKSSVDELVTVEYEESDIVKEYISEVCLDSLSSRCEIFSNVEEKYPAECLRSIDKANAYAVYKTKQGGLFYMYYTVSENGFAMLRHTAYSVKELSYADIKELKVGDSISKLEGIDPQVSFLREYYATTEAYNSQFGIVTILTDGVAYFEINKDNSGDYKISLIDYQEDFVFEASTENGIDANFKILDKDRI